MRHPHRPQQPAALADSITFLLEHTEVAEAMGERGRRAMADQYHWGPEGERLVALYDRLLAPPAARERMRPS